MGVYGIALPIIDAWTSQPDVINIVNELFNMTAQLVEAPSGDAETASTKRQPRSQLPELASCLFKCLQERLDWLARLDLSTPQYAPNSLLTHNRSPMAATDANAEREKSQLSDRFRQLRPDALEVLRTSSAAHVGRLTENCPRKE